MMDLRKILLSMSLLPAATSLIWADDIAYGGFGALDYIATNQPAGKSALDYIIDESSSKKSALDYVIGESTAKKSALDYVSEDHVVGSVDVNSVLESMVALAETNDVSAGALDVLTNYYKGGNYYKSGAWELNRYVGWGKTTFQNFWSGTMMQAPQWGKITSPFGYRARFKRMHKGIDIAMTVGDTVRVPLPGIVDRVSYEAGGYGLYVVVKHEGEMETRYAHLSKVMVSPGESVAAQQSVALSGNTGNSTGPHLHFETRYAGTPVDPETIFDFAGGMMMANNSAFPGGQYSAISNPLAAVEYSVYGNSKRGGKIKGSPLTDKSTYVVRAGDTLESVAARAGITVLRLCQLNSISTTGSLEPGRMIRLR